MHYLTLLIFVLFPFSLFAIDFIKGADISWVTGQEKNGIVFKDTLGRSRDILDILKNDYQMNTIRLRVFVNPTNDWGNGLCDINATVKMAKRVQQANMMLMLTLHYSDSWADPSKQTPPAAWKNFNVTQLEEAVYNHTKEVMSALAAVDVYPVQVQIGNETNDGMLWENGKASKKHMVNYARFVSSGNKAVKEISPATQTVVHLSNGFDEALYRWNIDSLIIYNAQFDIVGMSAYPEYRNNTTVNDWEDFNNDVFANITSVITRSKKPVIIAETGMHYTAEEQCRKMIADMLKKMRAIKNNMGLGILYWEPQAGPGYNRGYNLGAWGADGRPTQALKGFIDSSKTSTVIAVKKQEFISSDAIYSFAHYNSANSLKKYLHTPVQLYQANGRAIYLGANSKLLSTKISKGTYLLRKK
ncbi:MAG: glycosyl hydrolase 53 family protein [Chitinispirillaceae bacterium]|nr:glycosyl hydrolase 53 family protein [Chitinispirillaceae bacterium]